MYSEPAKLEQTLLFLFFERAAEVLMRGGSGWRLLSLEFSAHEHARFHFVS